MIARARLYLRAATEACGTGAVVRLVVVMLAGAVLEALVLALVVPLISLLAGADHVALPLLGGEVGAVPLLVVAGVVVLLRGAAQWRSAIGASDVRLRTTDRLRLRALSGVLGAEWTYLARQRRSDVVQATTVEVERAEVTLDLGLRIVVEGLLLAASATVAIAIAPVLGGLAVVALLGVFVLGRRSVRRSVDLGVEWSRRNLLFGATVTDSLGSLRLIRAHDAADEWLRLLGDAAEAGRRVQHRYAEITAGLNALVGFAALAAALGLVLLGRAMGLGVAELMALAVITTRLLALARALLTNVQAFAHYAPGLDAVERIIAETAAHRDRTAGTAPAPTAGPETAAPVVELRGVTARYGDRPVLEGLDLAVPRGGLVVVTGPSGVGKSTLLDVVLGLLPPAAGEVLAGGRPVTDQRAWRARVGYVPQQDLLIPGSVRENLAWSAGRPVTDDDVWAALETACAADVVRRLPEGLDTVLHDLAQLSGGEQQRLCIARALVRAPELLVLDEATSALDADTERDLLANLRRSGASLLVATHRPAVVEAADEVVRLGAPA